MCYRYSRNIVCLLPQVEKYVQDNIEFSRLSEGQSSKVAKELLLTAFDGEEDPIVKREIEKAISPAIGIGPSFS
jgi:hypothetical protein